MGAERRINCGAYGKSLTYGQSSYSNIHAQNSLIIQSWYLGRSTHFWHEILNRVKLYIPLHSSCCIAPVYNLPYTKTAGLKGLDIMAFRCLYSPIKDLISSLQERKFHFRTSGHKYIDIHELPAVELKSSPLSRNIVVAQKLKADELSSSS